MHLCSSPSCQVPAEQGACHLRYREAQRSSDVNLARPISMPGFSLLGPPGAGFLGGPLTFESSPLSDKILTRDQRLGQQMTDLSRETDHTMVCYLTFTRDVALSQICSTSLKARWRVRFHDHMNANLEPTKITSDYVGVSRDIWI